MKDFSFLPDRDFLKQIFTLSSASILSQAIAFAASLVLFRIYSPEEYGKFGIFVTISTLISIVGTGQLHHAIFISESKKQIEELITSILGLSLITSVLISILLFIFYGQTEWISFKGIWLLPLSVLNGSITFLVSSLATVLKEFTLISYQRIYQALIAPVLSIGFGIWFQKAEGLILGYLIGQIICNLMFYPKLSQAYKFKFGINNLDWNKLWSKFKNFPLFTLPSELINALINQLPVILLGQFFSLQTVGHYKMATTILNLPIGSVSNPVSLVFKQQAAAMLAISNTCKSIYIKSTRVLLLVGIFPYLILAIAGPWLLTYIFGIEWKPAGSILQVLSALYFAKFVVSPLTIITQLTGHQKFALGFNILLLFITGLLFVVGNRFGWNYLKLLGWYAMVYGSLYVITYWMCYKFCSSVQAT